MISVVTPTLRRPREVAGLLENLVRQTMLPAELILVDGADESDNATADVFAQSVPELPFAARYIRHGGGTAIQRNVGIDVSTGSYIAFIDDDIRLDPLFFEHILGVFAADRGRRIGGVTGYRITDHFKGSDTERWWWYARLRLLGTYEPGRYDFTSGYPINANMQPPFTGVRDVDFMSTSCAVWRRDVVHSGLRFDPFFRDFGVLEDAHFSLRARRSWRLVQCGDARCDHLHASGGRVDTRKLGYKAVVNYYYVFRDINGPLGWGRQLRFWRFQAFEFLRITASAVRRRRWSDVMELRGRIDGVLAVARGV
ncbi:MAG: glycosyltransferase [Acidobacteria bacterium]|nr:MAG: glycosyltransferase [Acidobacteriota bacterium]